MSESVNTFMAIYVGDYLKKTTMLSCEEHGAYFLLLCSLWQNDGYLENDNRKLAKIVGVSAQKFSKIMSNISKYFEVGENGIYNNRLLEELEKAHLRRVRAQTNGRNGGRPKLVTQEKPSGIPSGLATDNPEPNPEKSSPPSPSPLNTNTPPTPKGEVDLSTAIEFANSKGLVDVDVLMWHESRVDSGWVKINGKKVKDWKLDLIACKVQRKFLKLSKPIKKTEEELRAEAVINLSKTWRTNV
jgi:uncharacterized protein YdaU (DUF1376 family)